MKKSLHVSVTDSSEIFKVETITKHLLILWGMAVFATLIFLVSTGCNPGTSQEEADTQAVSMLALYDSQFLLYSSEIPGCISYDLEETSAGEDENLRYYNVSEPTLSVFLPPEDIATGTAVVVCPGGGYSAVSYGTGVIVAEALAENGIAAFVLKYRLPNDFIMADKSIGPLQDAQEAIRTVRQRAAEWGIDPDRVGILGHSAGGHVAASAGVHYDDVVVDKGEEIDLRPSFMILISSVISMDEGITHAGSRTRLLGDDPEPDLVTYFSNELQVTADTPPTWIAHAENDTVVPVENSERLFDALGENGVPVELNLYAAGGHSFIRDVTANGWLESLLEWMDSTGVTTGQ